MTQDVITCTICVSEIEENDEVALPCGHKFHGRCLAPWLWQTRNCPNCRESPDTPDNGPVIQLHEFLRHMREAERQTRNRVARATRRARASNAPVPLVRTKHLCDKWKHETLEEGRKIKAVEAQIKTETRRLRQEYARMREEWRVETIRVNHEYRTRLNPLNKELTRHRQRRRQARVNFKRYQERLVNVSQQITEEGRTPPRV